MCRKAWFVAVVGAVTLLAAGGCRLDSPAESETVGNAAGSVAAAEVRKTDPLRYDLPKQFGFFRAE
jgi:hypothetical protein